MKGIIVKKLKIGGRYKHYKGTMYRVTALARHSETLEELVVYRSLYGSGDYWVRPKDIFLEQVEVDGVKQARFELILEE